MGWFDLIVKSEGGLTAFASYWAYVPVNSFPHSGP